jgi:hypothetical protein
MAQTSTETMLVDLRKLVADIKTAESSWEVSAQAALALADIAQQSGALTRILHNVTERPVPPSPAAAAAAAPPPAAINVEATISSGSIDVCAGNISASVSGDIGACVRMDDWEAVDTRLRKAACTVLGLWAKVDERITSFGACLDSSIGKVATAICDLHRPAHQASESLRELVSENRIRNEVLRAELACICRSAKAISRHICGSEDEEEGTSRPREEEQRLATVESEMARTREWLGRFEAAREAAADVRRRELEEQLKRQRDWVEAQIAEAIARVPETPQERGKQSKR